MREKWYLLRLVFVGVVAVAGCSTQPQIAKNQTSPPAPVQQPVSLPPYRIQPGDTLDIKFFYNPELNETATVRPDGYISLQLIDDLHVVGMQPIELDAQITGKYARELKRPVVTVIVRSFAGQRVYIGGEVNQPGLITMTAGMTPLQAVMQSGGFKVTAQPSETLIIRKGPDRKPVPIRVDLNAMLEGDGGADDSSLIPGDIVYIPKSPIAKANQFVNQYIEQLLLFRGVSFGFSYQINDTGN